MFGSPVYGRPVDIGGSDCDSDGKTYTLCVLKCCLDYRSKVRIALMFMRYFTQIAHTLFCCVIFKVSATILAAMAMAVVPCSVPCHVWQPCSW